MTSTSKTKEAMYRDGRIAVFFLARGIGAGVNAAEEFFASYRNHPAGVDHDLIVLAKGWEGVPGLEDVRRMASEAGGKVLELPDDGFDFGAYFRAAKQVPHRWICLLNTHSRILVDHWLANLHDAVEPPGIGAAGATGLWESGFTDIITMPRFRDVKSSWWALYPARLLYSYYRFAPFPNPYLRSNALIIERRQLTEFARGTALPATKMQAQVLESGRRGLSQFLVRQGLKLVVVGADAQQFSPEAWPQSKTFFYPGQPNLMVSDNQTRGFDTADDARRRILVYRAWGRKGAFRSLGGGTDFPRCTPRSIAIF